MNLFRSKFPVFLEEFVVWKTDSLIWCQNKIILKACPMVGFILPKWVMLRINEMHSKHWSIYVCRIPTIWVLGPGSNKTRHMKIRSDIGKTHMPRPIWQDPGPNNCPKGWQIILHPFARTQIDMVLLSPKLLSRQYDRRVLYCLDSKTVDDSRG